MNTGVEMKHISKSFPGVQALKDVSLSVEEGEIRALVGENGAGKSTLIKILSGAYLADAGEINIRGQKVHYHSPLGALNLGIGAIYQEFNLVPYLSVGENIMLGQVPSRMGRLDREEMHRRAQTVLDQLNVPLDTKVKVRELDVAQQQIVEIAKGLARDLTIFIMDEPTAALNSVETEHLFDMIRQLKRRGVTILYISHRLNEIFELADTVTVLKDGVLVDTLPVSEVDEDAIVRMMIGRQLGDYYPPRGTVQDEVVFEVRNLRVADKVHDVNIQLYRGEILGLAGLEGHGQRELVQALFGAIPHDTGEFYINGNPLRIASPRDAMRNGIAFIPDDRKESGLVLIRSVRENLALPTLGERVDAGILINGREEQRFVRHMIKMLNIQVSRPSQLARNLSGGNQQKVVVGKWLGLRPQVLIVAEPTRGVDVGSKSEIHHLLRELAEDGVALFMLSSELPELLGMSDRIVVISEGHLVAEMPGNTATEEEIMAAATGAELALGEPLLAPAEVSSQGRGRYEG